MVASWIATSGFAEVVARGRPAARQTSPSLGLLFDFYKNLNNFGFAPHVGLTYYFYQDFLVDVGYAPLFSLTDHFPYDFFTEAAAAEAEAEEEADVQVGITMLIDVGIASHLGSTSYYPKNLFSVVGTAPYYFQNLFSVVGPASHFVATNYYPRDRLSDVGFASGLTDHFPKNFFFDSGRAFNRDLTHHYPKDFFFEVGFALHIGSSLVFLHLVVPEAAAYAETAVRDGLLGG